MDEFYGNGQWKLAAFQNEQQFGLEGVLGRLNSSSYAPATGTDAHARITEALTNLFAECRQDGLVTFRYETKVYVGQPERGSGIPELR